MSSYEFSCDNPRLQSRVAAALRGLEANLISLPGFERPVLKEGAEYGGIWLECGPHEGTLYGLWADPRIALHCHRIFFENQSEDGYLPCLMRPEQIGSGHVQTVIPIAATALETAILTGDKQFLQAAYTACSRYDDWLVRFRDTRATGLVELFCEWDTGHDNSPRLAGLPHACPPSAEHPGGDARVMPDLPQLPYLAPDLSATAYGGRIALAQMARLLYRDLESDAWLRKAEDTRTLLSAWCFDSDSECFYDLDADGQFVRVAGDATLRVLCEGAVDPSRFEAIYRRYVKNPEAFWTPYPFPSIAANDPAFVKELPGNSWGGASQALTALRAPRWLEREGKHADCAHLMDQWIEALCRSDRFCQQIHPWTGGVLEGADGYSPAMLVLLDFVARRFGVRPMLEAAAREGKMAPEWEWNCTLPPRCSWSEFKTENRFGTAELRTEGRKSSLKWNGELIAEVWGDCRLICDSRGRPLRLVGTANPGQGITLGLHPSRAACAPGIRPDEIIRVG